MAKRTDSEIKLLTWPREASVWLSAPLEAESFLCGGKCDAGESVPIDDYVSTALLWSILQNFFIGQKSPSMTVGTNKTQSLSLTIFFLSIWHICKQD